MSTQSRPFASALGVFILKLYIVLSVFSAIGAVTAAPQNSGSNSKTSGANKSKEKAYTVNVVKAQNTHSHTFEQSFSPNGGLTVTTGKYTVLLPNGQTQIVTYIADTNGYRTVVTHDNTKYETSARASDNVQAPPAPVSAKPSASRPPHCNVLPSPGECRGAFPRVFFNSTSSQCDCFLWGGCEDENTKSSWLTLEDCSATCIPDDTEPGPRCPKKQEVQTFVSPPQPPPPSATQPSAPQPNIAEDPAISSLNDADFLDSLLKGK